MDPVTTLGNCNPLWLDVVDGPWWLDDGPWLLDDGPWLLDDVIKELQLPNPVGDP
jgi:hypothetical protein